MNRKQKVFINLSASADKHHFDTRRVYKSDVSKMLLNFGKPLKLVNLKFHSNCRQRLALHRRSFIKLHSTSKPSHSTEHISEKKTINKSINRSDCQPNKAGSSTREANQKMLPKLNSLLSKL